MTNAERLRANDEKFGYESKRASMSRAEKMDELRSAIAGAQNELARLEVEQANEDNQNVAVVTGPGGTVVDNTGIDGQDPEGAQGEKETYSDTKYWTVGRLQDEIDNRNEERVAQNLEPIDRNGKRAELVERLLKDDEELED